MNTGYFIVPSERFFQWFDAFALNDNKPETLRRFEEDLKADDALLQGMLSYF